MSAFGNNFPAFGTQSNGGANAGAFGQKPAGAGLFGSTTNAAPTSSIFGAPAANASNQATSNNIFGQPQPQPTTGGLFGQTATAQQQQQPVLNAFGGSTLGQNNNIGQQALGTGTSLFGSTNQNQQAPSSNLFGGTSTTNQANFGSGSNFGSNPTTNTAQQPFNQYLFGQKPNIFGGGGFGSGQAQATQHANTNAWGTPANAGGVSIFGQKPVAGAQSGFGATLQPQASTISAPVFTRTTKFNDLPDNIKKTLEEIDSHIQGRIQIANDLKSRNLGLEPTKGRTEILGVHKDLLSLSSDVQSDSAFVRDLKFKADQTVQDTIAATRIVDGFKNPNINGVLLKNYATFPLEYFMRVSEQMKERLRWCNTIIEQIDRKLSSNTARAQSTPQAISATLNAQHEIFISLASKTAALSADMEHIKRVYTQLWRAKTGSMRDPFSDRNLSDDVGISSLRG